jgi:hypothetical protein
VKISLIEAHQRVRLTRPLLLKPARSITLSILGPVPGYAPELSVSLLWVLSPEIIS